MNDPAAPDEQAPYWDKCEKMTFAQLRRFIHDVLERLSDPSVPDNEELPRSQEELLGLCDMLKAKSDVLKDDAPMPERPTYAGPAHPGWSFTPSDELDALYRKRREAQDRVDYATQHGESKIFIEYIEDELEKVEREITPIERRADQEHADRLREYQEAHEPYMRRIRLWRAEVEKVEKQREAEAKRDEAVQRAYRKVKRAFDPKRASGPKSMGTLPFELAAPGERTDDRAIYRYYQEVMSRKRLSGFDQDRLDKLLALPRSNWAKGSAGSDGYIVLMFDHTEKVLMECPIRDNAIYVLDSGEKRLLKMNKQELIASDEVKRIFHRGDWYGRVKQELGISTSTEQSDE